MIKKNTRKIVKRVVKQGVIVVILVLVISSKSCFTGQDRYKKTDIEKSGDILQIVFPLTAFGYTLMWRDKKGMLQFVKTSGMSFFLTHGLKRSINKTRPSGGNYSFPSGHTSNAFTQAAFLQKRYGWESRSIFAYLLAGYVGWTRVYANAHDYWDIFGGAIIGVGSAYMFTTAYEKKNMELSFWKQEDSYVLRWMYRF